MPTILRGIVLFMVMVGCVTPPLVRSVTGGGMTIGPEAECLVHQGGVVSLWELFDSVGTGIKVGDNLVLTAHHVIDDGRFAFSADGVITDVRIVRQGDTALRDQDWCLARMDTPRSTPVCPYEPTFTVTPGQDVLILGYWGPDSDYGRSPVAVTGTVIETPHAFAQQLGDFVCMDLGSPITFSGLSGSPVLVKDPGSAEWRLAGVFTGQGHTDRQDHLNVFTRLPRNFKELLKPSLH